MSFIVGVAFISKMLVRVVGSIIPFLALFVLLIIVFAFILFVEFGSCEDVQYFSTVGDFISDYSESGSNVLDYVTLENDPKSSKFYFLGHKS